MHQVYLGLGSNMSNPLKQLKDAIHSINNLEKTTVKKKSNVYESLPVGYLNQANFFNQVISIETNLLPKELLHHFQEIEKKQKRIKRIFNGPRTIDIDILLFDDLCINEKELIIPHPRMMERAFVMIPLLEIEPLIKIPKINNLEEFLGKLEIKNINKLNDKSL
jgi:2-amino-4-hydroxy-6-hydroxymethyldihydropteridine diphosphokinase